MIKIASLVIALATPLCAADYDAAAKASRALLEQLVAADMSNPPGNEARGVAIGAARLKEAGIPHEIVEFAPGRQNLVARLKGSGKKKPLLLLSHIDVVNSSGQSWTVPYDKLTERDGYLYGRGVIDMLGMAALSLETLVLLKQSGAALDRDVILAWTGDEESGGLGILKLLKDRRELIDAEFAFNEGGGLVLGADGKLNRAEMQLAEKIYQDFVLTAKGTTGHSSVPLADNAIYRLAKALDRMGSFKEPARLLPLTRAYLRARAAVEPPERAKAMRAAADAKGAPPKDALALLDSDAALSAVLRTTCVATMLSGGTRVNSLPAEAKATINCRILPDETVEQVRARIARVIDDPKIEITLDGELGASAEASPVDGPAMAGIEKTIRGFWPGLPIVPFMSRGATDSRHLRAAGIAAYGLRPFATSEEDGRRAHGIDERIPADSLRPGVEFLHALTLELAGAR